MYSLPAHKEFRFLLPALCLLMPYCGVSLEDLANRFKEQCLAEGGLVFEVRDPRPALPASFLHTPCCMHRRCAVRHARRARRSLPKSLLTCLSGPHLPVGKMSLWHVQPALLLLPANMPLQCLCHRNCACQLQHHNHSCRCSCHNTSHVHVPCCRLCLRKQGAAVFTARPRFPQASLTSPLTGQQLQLHGSCQRSWMKLLKNVAAPS